MTNKQLQERRKRRKRIRRIRMAIKIAVYALMALLVVGVVWAIGSKLIKKDKTEEIPEDVVVVEEQQTTETVAEAAKAAYTGTGGRKGWNVDDAGWWYLNDDETIYTSGWQTIDGNTYYFDENGYMVTGWKQIDGEYYFFQQDGLVQPEATEKLVALTYDDGPSSYTDRLLDCLEANGAKATFFVVGEQVERFPETLQREDELGMEIGSHTYDHPYMKQLDAAGIQNTLSKNEEVITSLIGHGTSIMRPTGGALSDLIRANVNSPLIIWDLDTLDWETKNVDSIVSEILNNVKDGSIVLMHDLYETTVEASEIIIPELVSRGYRMVTVSELAELRGVTLEAGEDYEAFYVPEPESDTQQVDTPEDSEEPAERAEE